MEWSLVKENGETRSLYAFRGDPQEIDVMLSAPSESTELSADCAEIERDATDEI